MILGGEEVQQTALCLQFALELVVPGALSRLYSTCCHEAIAAVQAPPTRSEPSAEAPRLLQAQHLGLGIEAGGQRGRTLVLRRGELGQRTEGKGERTGLEL